MPSQTVHRDQADGWAALSHSHLKIVNPRSLCSPVTANSSSSPWRADQSRSADEGRRSYQAIDGYSTRPRGSRGTPSSPTLVTPTAVIRPGAGASRWAWHITCSAARRICSGSWQGPYPSLITGVGTFDTLTTDPSPATRAALMCVVPMSTPHSRPASSGNRLQSFHGLVSIQPAVHDLHQCPHHGGPLGGAPLPYLAPDDDPGRARSHRLADQPDQVGSARHLR